MGLPVNTPRWGNDQCTSGLQFNKAGYDQNRKYVVILCSEAVETKLVKLETSSTVILPPTVSVLWCLFLKRFEALVFFYYSLRPSPLHCFRSPRSYLEASVSVSAAAYQCDQKKLPNVCKSCPKMISSKNDIFWHLYKNCLRMWEICAN